MSLSRKGIPPPDGRSAEMEFHRNQGRVTNHELKPKDSSSVKWQRTTQGWSARMIAPPRTQSGASLMMMQITELNGGDYVTAANWDGTNQTGTFKVAKIPKLRTSLASRNTYGVTLNYTYTDDNHRVANDGTHTENEVMIDEYQVGDVIFVEAVKPHTGVEDPDNPGKFITLLEVEPNRNWALPTVAT